MRSRLFTPIQVGPITLANRIVIAPMCQYSADDAGIASVRGAPCGLGSKRFNSTRRTPTCSMSSSCDCRTIAMLNMAGRSRSACAFHWKFSKRCARRPLSIAPPAFEFQALIGRRKAGHQTK